MAPLDYKARISDTAVLKNDIKSLIILELNLEGLTPEDIDDQAPLFVEGLGLDSIDAMEIVILLEKYYDVKIKDEETGREVFKSVQTIASFIQQYQPAQE